jgi:molybdopterin-guanine dinucleotide biosynthesis protein A
MGGGDKCLRPLAGRPVLAHVVERVKPQVALLVLNANGDPKRFEEFGLPVAADEVEGYAGPLAGVLAGLDLAAANEPAIAYVLSVPTDAPFLPLDLAARLIEPVARGQADMAAASSGGQAHPVVGLWPVRLRDELRRALTEEGIRKVDAWTARYRLATVEFEAGEGVADPFFNANRPEDLAEAERLIARHTPR